MALLPPPDSYEARCRARDRALEAYYAQLDRGEAPDTEGLRGMPGVRGRSVGRVGAPPTSRGVRASERACPPPPPLHTRSLPLPP